MQEQKRKDFDSRGDFWFHVNVADDQSLDVHFKLGELVEETLTFPPVVTRFPEFDDLLQEIRINLVLLLDAF